MDSRRVELAGGSLTDPRERHQAELALVALLWSITAFSYVTERRPSRRWWGRGR